MLQRRSKKRSKKGATEIAQFPLTLYCLFLVLFLPVLNLVTLLIAGTTAYLATNDIVAKAATQSTFAQALNAMANEAYSFQSNALAQFVRMSPQGGYTGCGDDLYVLATNIGGAGVQSSAADQTLSASIDATKNIYEMQVVSSYSVSPLISLASIPLVGSIPGLGQPVNLSFTASRPIENPGGMQTSSSISATQAVTAFNRVTATAPGTTVAATSSSWRNPNIYQQIQAAGQTIVSENVFTVQAINPNWTPSGVSIVQGQQIWVDTQAIGTWNTYPEAGVAATDANGYADTYKSDPGYMCPDLRGNSLSGQVGTAGTPFFIGNNQTSLPLSGSGQLSMICNDVLGDYGDNIGAQLVRVIVVK